MKNVFFALLLIVLSAPSYAQAQRTSGTDTYTINSAEYGDAHRSGGWAGAQGQAFNIIKTFYVPSNSRITNVRQVCNGEGCPWTYHTQPGRGYDMDYDIQNGGTSATWRRKIDGKPVIYTIYVDWEKR